MILMWNVALLYMFLQFLLLSILNTMNTVTLSMYEGMDVWMHLCFLIVLANKSKTDLKRDWEMSATNPHLFFHLTSNEMLCSFYIYCELNRCLDGRTGCPLCTRTFRILCVSTQILAANGWVLVRYYNLLNTKTISVSSFRGENRPSVSWIQIVYLSGFADVLQPGF